MPLQNLGFLCSCAQVGWDGGSDRSIFSQHMQLPNVLAHVPGLLIAFAIQLHGKMQVSTCRLNLPPTPPH